MRDESGLYNWVPRLADFGMAVCVPDMHEVGVWVTQDADAERTEGRRRHRARSCSLRNRCRRDGGAGQGAHGNRCDGYDYDDTTSSVTELMENTKNFVVLPE